MPYIDVYGNHSDSTDLAGVLVSFFSSPQPLPTPKRTKKLLSSTDDGESERSSPTVSSVMDDRNDELKPVTPVSPVFARTRKISEIAARRRVGLDKRLSSNSKTSSLEPDGELHVKSSSVTDMRAHDQAAESQKSKLDNGLSAKASRSMSDLSVIDKRAGDVSSEDSARVVKKKGAVRSKVKKPPQRKPRRLRSASLDDSKVLRGECCGLVMSGSTTSDFHLLFNVAILKKIIKIIIINHIICYAPVKRSQCCDVTTFTLLVQNVGVFPNPAVVPAL